MGIRRLAAALLGVALILATALPALAADDPPPWGEFDQQPPVVAQTGGVTSSTSAAPAKPKVVPTDNPPPPPSATACVDVGAGLCVNADPDLEETITLLSHTKTGSGYLRTAARGGYIVHWGDLPTNVLGLFRSDAQDVVMSNVLKGFPVVDRAPVLAHELTHASDWTANNSLMLTVNGCFSTEIHAFHTEAATWRELAGTDVKPANDMEREYEMINKAIAADPTGFIDRLTAVYHSQCLPVSS